MRRFEFEEATLALEAPSVAAEMSRSAECTMARDYNSDRICAIGGSDGANRARASDTSRDFGVRAGLAAGDSAELVPHEALKWGAADIERQFEDCGIAVKIFCDRARPFAGEGVVALDRGFRIIRAKLGNDHAIRVAERGETKTMASAGDKQASQRRIHDRIPDSRATAAGAV